MAKLVRGPNGFRFVGSIDVDEDVDDAAKLAAVCGSFRRDDEDEDPLDGALNCFACRYRRWLPDGFTCMRGRLAACD
jgi:hypothetical protein